jgi:hypothetical protein
MRRQMRDSHAGIHQIPTRGRSHDGGIHRSRWPCYGPSALPTCHAGVHQQEGMREDGTADHDVHRRGWMWMSASSPTTQLCPGAAASPPSPSTASPPIIAPPPTVACSVVRLLEAPPRCTVFPSAIWPGREARVCSTPLCSSSSPWKPEFPP